MIEGESAAPGRGTANAHTWTIPHAFPPTTASRASGSSRAPPLQLLPSTRPVASRTSSTTFSRSRASTRCSSGSRTRSTRSSRTRRCTSTRLTSRSRDSCRRCAERVVRRSTTTSSLRSRHHRLAVEHREPVLSNQAHLDPRVERARDPARAGSADRRAADRRGALKGTLNVYRIGEDAFFTQEESELAKSLGDAAALALDNAHIRARLSAKRRPIRSPASTPPLFHSASAAS